MEILRFKFVAV